MAGVFLDHISACALAGVDADFAEVVLSDFAELVLSLKKQWTKIVIYTRHAENALHNTCNKV